MRALRNIAIIGGLALAIAFVPGGGRAGDAIVTVLGIAFLATIGAAAYQMYRQNQLTISTLPDRQRAILFGAVGVIALMIAAADELLATGGGTLVWIAAVALSALAIFRVWTEARTY